MCPNEVTKLSLTKEKEKADLVKVLNYINHSFIESSAKEYLPIVSPSTNCTIGQVALSNEDDVNAAVHAASEAFPAWSGMTIKSRAAIMLKFHGLVRDHAQELAECIVKENGKNITEALADVAKGNETVEYACSLPQLACGSNLKVSSKVTCTSTRKPLGVVASIVPFIFPFMVPMWTMPIALVMGNTFILKPSEKVPITMQLVMSLLEKAGLPKGVVNLVQGEKRVVEALIDHNDVKAVTFVGSSPVASIVSSRCHALNKRCTALGGAKNHLIALPDCEVEGAASDIVVSYAGCAGQRCMAASVLLLVGGEHDDLLQKIVEKSSSIQPGTGPGQMGAVIDNASHKKVMKYINGAEEAGAKILVDGRTWLSKQNPGNWIGPTVILHSSPDDVAMKEEIFGPVLSVYKVSSWSEAIDIENSNPFGNAASIYTSNGGHAEWFIDRFSASMLGVNIGIPVPREPFSFGGLYGTKSKYGDMDITGDGAIEFFSNRIKVTSKWPEPTVSEYLTGKKRSVDDVMTDHANFAGRM
jgi:malonate-semialdehyde dehydrogenase (acetylating)/methylmalonate-semialdehyde dehydrogenase